MVTENVSENKNNKITVDK